MTKALPIIIVVSAILLSACQIGRRDHDAVSTALLWPSVHVWVSNAEPQLRFWISNRLDRNFILQRQNVPWLNEDSVELTVVKSNSISKSIQTLKPVRGFVDGPAGDFIIPAHSTATGLLDVSGVFPELRERTAPNSYIITWRYVMHQQDSSKAFSGGVTISSDG
jgi:hypothetical protein